MKVAVTGGTGFLGSHVVESLLTAGHDPVCMVRDGSDTRHLDALGVTTVPSTLQDASSLGGLVDGADAVIHMAGLVKARRRRDFDAINGEGTRRLVEAAADAGVGRFTLVSSIAAKGPSPHPKPAPAGLGTAPVSDYGRSKAAGEAALLEHADDLSVRIVRPPVVYGPRDAALLDLFRAVRRGVFPRAGPKDALVSTIYGPDCAECIVQATKKDARRPMVIEPADGPPRGWDGFRDAVAGALGRERVLTVHTPGPLVSVVATLNQVTMGLAGKAAMLGRDKVREIKRPYWLADHTSASQRLGWEPSVDLDEGVRRTADWYQEQGLL